MKPTDNKKVKCDKKIRVAVMGATGYTGVELVKMLARHPNVDISMLTSESLVGEIYSNIYPSMCNICDLPLSSNDFDEIAERSDAVFLCLPHTASMSVAAYLYEKGKVVIDLSADYRLNSQELYEKTYSAKHTRPDLLNKAVYGLAEVNTEAIKSSNLIAVPGCYPTSALIPLIPLISCGAISTDKVIIDSKSGVSGAGKKATSATHYCEANESIKAYSIFNHRHKPEIEHIIKEVTSRSVKVVFTPHLVPLTRGMLSTIYATTDKGQGELLSILREYYEGEPLVRIKGEPSAIIDVANSPFIDISLKVGDKDEHGISDVVIISVIDNLLKGASSQAVQCFNIRYGFNTGSCL